MACSTTFIVKTRHVGNVQILVKKYSGFHRGNPYHYSDNTQFTIGFDDVLNMNEFHRDIERLEREIVEKDSRPGFWLKLWRRIRY